LKQKPSIELSPHHSEITDDELKNVIIELMQIFPTAVFVE